MFLWSSKIKGKFVLKGEFEKWTENQSGHTCPLLSKLILILYEYSYIYTTYIFILIGNINIYTYKN